VIPTLVIALREGVEASLIVGIVAAFLVKEGHREALKWMWIGVGIAVALCTTIAIGLRVVDDQLPQRQQEGLETVVGLIAVSMISYMIIWMRRNSRGLKKSLEGNAAMAVAAGSTIGLVGMAFLAVLREGFETAVFMLAAFQDTENPLAAGFGAVIGLVAAIVLGYLIYRGGVRINLSRFFRVTGLILVFVAAGLLASAVHTAHEAGWINSMQGQAMDLTWLVQPGTVSGALLTGMLGLQPKPTTGETLAYLLYAVPMGLFVIWPDNWHPFRKLTARKSAGAAAAAITAVALLVAGCGSGDDPPAGAKKLSFKLTDAGCDPADASAPAGPITFEVTNDGADAVTEMEILDGDKILGERENLTDGLSGDFSLNLEAGDYTIYCPGGDTESGTLTVTGSGGGTSSTAASPNATSAVSNYRQYVETNTAELVAKTKIFTDAVAADDVEAAKAAYPAARIPYERIEPVAESFGDLDPEIDARAGDVPAKQFGGFHRIEQALYVDNTTDGMAPVAQALQSDVELLEKKVQTIKLQPAQIGNGATELLNEVSTSKITGEEERYSHIDLVDFQANVEGAQAAFKSVEPIVNESDPALVKQINDGFAGVTQALEPYKQGDGYVTYTDLTEADKRKLSQAIDALAEPLSQVSAQVA
jgi:FTR1 family protein